LVNAAPIATDMPALNRESLQYDESSINLIRSRVKDAIDEIHMQVENIIKKQSTLLNAYKVYSDFQKLG
jgi:hypothetical protein